MWSNSCDRVKKGLSRVYYTGHLGGVTDAHPRGIQVTNEKNKVVKDGQLASSCRTVI